MMDRAIRGLEVRWLASGDTGDGAEYLRALVAVGALTNAQIRVAALCGQPSALMLAAVDEPPQDPVALVFRLEEFGPEAHVCAAAAALESARPVVSSETGTTLLQAAELLRAWLITPTESLANRIKGAGYLTDPAAIGGAASAVRWAVSQHKFFELDRRADYVDPDLLVEQERIVLTAIRRSCLEWALGDRVKLP